MRTDDRQNENFAFGGLGNFPAPRPQGHGLVIHPKAIENAAFRKKEHHMADLIIDPEFHALLPALTPKEYNGLQASILADGCIDPIVLWGKIIIDGMNRYEICREHKKGFKIQTINLAGRDDAIAWIIDHQNGRRNLNESQRAMLAARRAKLKPGQHPCSANLQSTGTAAQVGKVSTRSVADAKTVIEDGTPALQQAVTDGKVSVSAAAKITDLPAAEQDRLAAEGRKAVARAAKEKDEPKKEAAPRDRFGVTIPDIASCREGLARAEGVASVMREVSALKSKIVANLDNKKDPIYGRVDRSIVEAGLSNVFYQLKNAKPYPVCPHC